MNDRFKFRVWDKEQGKYLPLYSHTDILDMWIFLDNTGVYLVERDNNRDLAFFNDITKDVVIQQCTGLKDKNGTLIYEGDLIRYTEYELDEAEPDWEYTEIVWGGSHYYPAFDLKVHNFDCNGLSYIFNEGWTIEVIGNIYENKDLLNENS